MGREEYFEHIKNILPDADGYIASIDGEPFRGIRVNTLKCGAEKLSALLGGLDAVPFCDSGFYLPKGGGLSGNHPLHHAGAFYFQEPSAMSVAEALNVEEGDRVLDLCAAPGGKSTQIAARLRGKGIIWSNEINRGRARVLLSNIERMGVKNAVVSSCRPDVLCEKLVGRFDKVLVDAPCSGEGMIRRERDILDNWSIESVRACAKRQLNILHSAAAALRDGGVMAYSTCTFSPEENEQVIGAFLHEHRDFELIESGVGFGSPAFARFAPDCPDIALARRILPNHGGEGHFLALMRKKGFAARCDKPFKPKKQSVVPRCFYDFYEENFHGEPYGVPCRMGDTVALLPPDMPDTEGLPVLRAGVAAGEIRGERFEPAHALFMAADVQNVRRVIDLDFDSTDIAAFLHGDELAANGEKGFTAVAVNGITAGFGKISGGRLKNHYPKGLRTLK